MHTIAYAEGLWFHVCVSPATPPTFEKCEAIYTNDKSVGLSHS